MKKMLSVILALCLVFTLAACGSDPEPTTVPTTEPTAAPTTAPQEPSVSENTEPVVHNLPMTAISITEQTEVTNGADGDPVFEYTYPNIRLILPDPEQSMSVNLDILNRIDTSRSAAADMMTDAVEGDPEYPHSLSVRYIPMRLDSSTLSLFVQQTSYSGGSTLRSGQGLTYDLTTGSVLTLEDVLVSGITADVICPLVIDALAALPEDYFIFSDYSSTVESRFAGDFLKDESWHFSAEGMCFTFAPYEVAPNSTGFVHALIPYDKLTGILNDEWFPPERVKPDGTLEVLPFLKDAAQYDQFAELNLDPIGGSYLLHATGLIYDVKIESGFWNMDGTVFTPERTVFMADSMVPSNAVMVKTDIPDVLPRLRITYTDPEGTVTVYLSASGEDGSPLLLTY